eukprot:5019369-Amphidinium_carterae.1
MKLDHLNCRDGLPGRFKSLGQANDILAASSFFSCSSTSAVCRALAAIDPAAAKRNREVCIEA